MSAREMTRCRAQYSPESPECGRPMPCLTHYPDPPVRPEQPSLADGLDRHRFGHRGLLILSVLLAVGLSACSAAEGLGPASPSPVSVDRAKGGAPLSPTDFGCPIVIGLGAKGYEGPHPGQWLRASYTMAVCGPDEWSTAWIVSPQPKLMDICRDSTALAAKECGHKVGKFLWIGTPGVYDVTALAPEGLGAATLYRVVVD